jgi:hypothetical protein
MKRILAIATAVPLAAFAAAAQDTAPLQIKMLDVRGAVMGKTVKGAPYSGTEINENNQTLADGTRIHNETQTQVWRDSEGRVRRETGNQVMIYDPVANASYSLNTKNQTARKLPLGTYMFSSNSDGSKTTTQYFRYSTLPDPPDAQKVRLEAQMEKLAALHTEYGANHPEMKKAEQDVVETKRNMEMGTFTLSTDGAVRGVVKGSKAVSQSLGKRSMEGVNADGTSETATIEAGAIGNDRPIQSVSERWFSSDLQTVMMSRHSDPRTGEETFKLVNVSRTEPPVYLFQVPAGYQMLQ